MKKSKLRDPIMIAAWPGMGHVALTACYYLIAKLKMEFRTEYATSDLFDVDHVAIEAGLVQPFRYPKNQFFVWSNPDIDGQDLIVFIGEAQPPHGRYNFCRKLVDYAQSEGVSKIFTFAAMATGIELLDDSQVIGVATDTSTMHQLIENEIALLQSGTISGMNGILLGVAAERKIPGGCLLGEMPATFINVPYPKASQTVLESFVKVAGIELDMIDLYYEVRKMEVHLKEAIDQIRRLEHPQPEGFDEQETYLPNPADNGKLTAEDKDLIERLFLEARDDRGKAFELKSELDRLDVFREYENRFLDLFSVDGENE